jgi:hypothetical protein
MQLPSPRVNMTSRPRSTFPGTPVRDSATSPYSLERRHQGKMMSAFSVVAANATPAAKSIWRFTDIPPFGDSVTFREPSHAPAMIATTHFAFCI